MSKGSRRRPTDEKAFRENHERVFGVREIKTWKPDEDGPTLDDVIEGRVGEVTIEQMFSIMAEGARSNAEFDRQGIDLSQVRDGGAVQVKVTKGE